MTADVIPLLLFFQLFFFPFSFSLMTPNIFLNSKLVADNYASVTKKHFLPLCGSNGADPLPQDLFMRSSGFVKDVPLTIPRSLQVMNT